MAANQFLQFAPGPGANVLSQAAYTADALRLTGNVAGIARSNINNKAFLQSSTMAAAVAQFIADNQATDVTDALTPAAIATMLATAIAAAFPAASATVQGKIEIATNGEIQTGTDTVRAVTPAGLVSRGATELITGLIELATAAEVIAGTDLVRAVTPAGLASLTSTESRRGLVKLANGPEIVGGTDATVAVSPFQLLQSFLGLGGANGSNYAKFPYRDRTSGIRRELIIQWGQVATTAGTGTANFTWPLVFPSLCLKCVCSPRIASSTPVSAGTTGVWSNTGGTAWSSFNGTTNAVTIDYIAIGL